MNNKNPSASPARFRFAVMAGLLIGLSNGSYAADLNGAFTVGVGNSDNIGRTATNEIEDSMGVVGVQFGYVEATRKFNADIQVNATYFTYQDTFDAEVVGGATVLADYFFVEEMLFWDLQYNYGQQVFDPLQPVTPGNRENVSYLTTGPSLSLPIGAQFFFGTDLRYSNVTYEVRNNDNNRGSALVQLGREFGGAKTFSLNFATEQVTFDDDVENTNFDRNEAFVRYESDSSRNEVTIDIGYNELELDGIMETGEGTLLRLSWRRIMSTNATLDVGGGSRYSDQGDIFRNFQDRSVDLSQTEDVIGVSTPFQNDYANIRYNRTGERTSLLIFADWDDEDYVDSTTLDRRLIRIGGSISRQFTRKISGELFASYTTRDFGGLSREDEDTRFTITLGYAFTPAVNASFIYQYVDRASTLEVNEFTENRLFLEFGYIPGWGR